MPLSYVVKCDGDDCPREDRAQFDPQRGYFAAGWHSYDGRTFCSHLCCAKYAARQAAEETRLMQEALNGATEETPVG